MNRNKETLLALFQKHKIDTSSWGDGEANSLGNLIREYLVGECEVVELDGRLVRQTQGVALNIFFTEEGGERLKLKESKQVFRDGRVRIRDLATSIGEKLQPNEPVFVGIKRALEEELEIVCDDLRSLLEPADSIVKGPVESKSYPGLLSLFRFCVFNLELPEKHYRPEGYIEVQDDKTSYFVWVPIDEF